MKLGSVRILSLVGFRILDLDFGLHRVKFPRFQIPEAKVSPFPETGFPFVEREVLKVMLHGTIRNDDFYRNTVLQYCYDIVWNIYNIVPTLQRCVALKIVVANRTV